jgi:hypothetical protein
MAPVMMTIHAPGGTPDLHGIMTKYGLSPSEIDSQFGVVPLGNDDYTILVESTAAHKVSPDTDWNTEGPYSNPKIEPFNLQ